MQGVIIMNKYISRGLWGVLFVAGLSLLGVGAANAAETSGDDGTASGTQGVAAVAAPVSLGGNAISVVGDSSSSSPSGPSGASQAESSQAAPTSNSDANTSGSNSLGGGTQGVVDTVAPVEASGNAVSVLGDSSSVGSTPSSTTGGSTGSTSTGSGAATTSGQDSTAGGTQVLPSVIAPASANGNAVSVLGDSSSQSPASSSPTTTTTGNGGPTTVGTDGVAGGSQLAPQVALPIGASGNAVSVIGDSESSGSTITAGGSPGVTTPSVAPSGGTNTAGLPGGTGSGGSTADGMSLASLGTLALTGTDPAAALALLSVLIAAGLAMIGFARRTQHRN
jgi:hypothetical protein